MSLDPKEFSKIPYLDQSVLGGRVVPIMPLWDGQKWHMWVQADKNLMQISIVNAVHTDYVAKQAAKDSDLFIPFVNRMRQQAGWRETAPLAQAICDDFHCLVTSLSKLKHIHKTREGVESTATSAYAATEVQYICVVARSISDLL